LLSYSQQRLWFLDRLQTETAAYNELKAYRLLGPLDVAALQRSLNEIIRRHESLRTTFGEQAADPVQVVANGHVIPLPIVDLCHVPAEQQAPEIESRAADYAALPFDLARDLMLRTMLLRFSPEHHVLLRVMHHIATDGWSSDVFWKELSTLYTAFAQGLASPLRELPIQYADFAQWQRRTLQGPPLDRLLAYWKDQLSGLPEQLTLATDRPRPAVVSYRGARVALSVPARLTAELGAIGRRQRSTLFMTLLAAWQLLLSRYSGQTDIVVGTPVAGRNRPELEPMIGFFVNTLLVRVDLSGDPTFLELLQRVRNAALGAYAHLDLPFEKLVEELRPERSLSRSPLCQVVFAFQNSAPIAGEFWGLAASKVDVAPLTSKFDLTLSLRDAADGLSGCLEYSSDLFDRGTIERMAGHFQTLLEGIAADPQRRLSQLPLLTEPERQQLLVEWNDTAVEYPRDQCVHQLFEQQVERTPEAVAVVFQAQEVTYRELNRRSNQLAHYLRSLGVGPETLVGLYLDRSVDLVVAILGILKAGGAYVPLDPSLPPERVKYQLEDSKCSIVIALDRLQSLLPTKQVSLDADWPTISKYSVDALESGLHSGNLAYVIYTSGSTGHPKGVAVMHRGLSNYVLWSITAYSVAKLSGAALHTSLAVDLSVTSLWPPLCAGRKIIMIEETGLDALPRSLSQGFDLGLLKLTPTHLKAISPKQLEVATGNVETLVVGGEQLMGEELTGWRRRFSNVRIINEYGPTETVVGSCSYEVPAGVSAVGAVAIGRPIANTTVYVLDRQRQPVPIGVPGELYIGGAGLARGYLNRPELTAERFVHNPFSGDPAARLYRTGDLCRWRGDGNLEFLGRLDEQVKLRGFRIELGEIETVLSEHPSVAQSVVAMREDRPGDKRLVGYCVPAVGAALDIPALKRHLQTKLPDYMVPSTFVALPSFPLTPSGKINRRALPAPDDSRPELETPYTDPRNLIEEQLASIWCAVLGIERVGIHDNFFALGGHSLLATRVQVRIAAALQVQLPLRKLFEAPTIAELAAVVQTLRRGGLSLRGTAVKRVDREQLGRLPLSFAQQRLWFLEQMEGELTAYNVPFAWRLRGYLDAEALRRSLEAIVRRHEALRTTFAMNEEEPVQVIGMIPRFELPVEDLRSFASECQETEIVRRTRLEAERPFDLTCDLMLRASLLRLAEDEQVLLLTMHHIASDGWSLHILWRELGLLYDAYRRKSDLALPALPVQYADYAAWQRQELEGERLPRLLQYWRRQLDGVSALELPTDRPRPPVLTYQTGRHYFWLSLELVDQLKALSQREGVTLHMLLLAAFQALLARYSGQDDIAVGTPIAGRNHAALEDLIGFFVNTLVLRTSLAGDPTFRELLGRVREVSLAAFDHQDLPFEKLVEELQPQRRVNRNPLVQAFFQSLSFSDKDLALGELEVTRIPSASGRARFDLEMHLWQKPQGIRGSVVYSTDLFDQPTMERMVGHFVTVLEAIVADVDQRLSELPLLTAPERQQLLAEWNDTAVEYPRDQCVHQRFEQQVERTPDAVAVVFQDQQFTYRELNRRSNQLAHCLRSLGVGPETLVGLCLERSVDLVVGILGILKAGGAYVPLDADYPRSRLEFMLADAQVKFLVTQERLLSRLPATDCQLVCVDRDAARLKNSAGSNPSVNAAADNLAYVMYTSGSTGQPKGVAIRHASILRLVLGNDYATFGPDRVFLQLATVSFDASTFELWGSLLHGAKLVIAPAGLPDLWQLEDLVKRHRVTTLWLTATFFNHVVDHQVQALQGVQEILTGGEALSASHIRKAQAALGDAVQLVNGYGPTESTTFTACYRIPQHLSPEVESIPIGRPIANTTVYVLDRQRQPVPIGVPGELYIGGAGLARGYLNRPEMTAEKFFPNPFTNEPAARLYRTGDLCRRRGDGNLEFLGRLDEQVKLRGFRIELGEIETVLSEHPSVAQSVVAMREDRPGEKRLVGYCVPAADAALDIPALKRHLQTKLPDYMVPSTFVTLPSFPLMPSGKINRRALPEPDDSRPELDAGYEAPRTAIEQQLATIWCELLARERVGVDDDFFALGGHSLLAVRLFARIDKTFGRKLPLAVLFQHGTIRHLAKLIRESGSALEVASVLPLQPGGVGRPLFLMPSLGGELLFSRALLDELAGRVPVFGIQPVLIAQNLAQLSDFRETARSFVSALRTCQPQGPYALAGFSYGGLMAFEVACQLAEMGEQVDLLAVIDTGPERRGSQTPLVDCGRRLLRVASNLPFWLRDEVREFSASRWIASAARKLRYWLRFMASGGRKSRELDDLFDINQLPSQNVELMRAVFAAARDYVPRPYAGKLTLFRANVRPLLSGSSHDLGWSRFVRAVDVRSIQGNHESILQQPQVGQWARQLGALLEDRAIGLQLTHQQPEVRATPARLEDPTKDRLVGV
jgi:amino acid adenylation domain-containing protein